MKQRSILRRCVACRKLRDRKHFWKITKDFKEGVILDIGTGRSAYLCQNSECLDEAWRRKRLQKALRCTVELGIIDELKHRLNQNIASISEAIQKN